MSKANKEENIIPKNGIKFDLEKIVLKANFRKPIYSILFLDIW